MNNISLILVSFITIMMTCCYSCEIEKSPFLFQETDQGIGLSENGKPVFVYQRKPKSPAGQNFFSNYIHPLFSLKGDTLTEEFPPDHLNHRGIFWAWHQLYVDSVNIGSGWINDNITVDVIDLKTQNKNTQVRINIEAIWKSSEFCDGKPFMNEHTIIIVHQLESDIRKIDFEIRLKPLVEGFLIGGSSDEKGYGGFCTRIKLPDNLIFTSENGQVTPQLLQINSGPWMDFSGDFGQDSVISGLTILCHPDNPDYPAPWILRQKGSMQNVVFPGQNKISIPMDNPVVLRYRLIIHNGNAVSLNIPGLQSEYEKMDF